MKKSSLVFACLGLVAGTAIAAEDMKKGDAMMKKDAMCNDMVKKDGAMAPDAAASGRMMKK